MSDAPTSTNAPREDRPVRRSATPPTGGRPGVRTRVDVVAVVVTRGESEYLAETLAGLAAQTRPPERVVVVDAGEGTRLPRTVPAPHARTFGDAVRAGLAHAGEPPTTSGGAWVWLLHDDSTPEPDALEALLAAVELAPSVGVAGCKQRTWSGPVRVLEVGFTTSRFGRRMTGLDTPEVDQGQHDAREDVLAVGLAGALVRRDVWDDLGGPDPALGPYGDGLDLCRRARLAGHRVVVVPGAVVRHAQASLARPVAGAILNRPGWDARRSAQARREAYLHSQLAGVPLGLVPLVAVLAVVSSLVRAMARLVLKEPHLVVAELLAPWAVLARPGRVVRARRRASRTRRMRRSSLRPLQASWRDVVRQERDRRLAAAELRRVRTAPSELELAELAALRSRRRAGLAAVGVLALVLTALTVRPLVAGVLAGGRLVGGTLAEGPASLRAVLAGLGDGWVEADLGHAAAADPVLTALLPLTALTGSQQGAVTVVVLGALALAALGGWFAAGAATRSVGLRLWAALTWVAAPALLMSLDQARLGGLLAHVALPWLVLATARAIGTARVDAVASGVLDARREDDDASAPSSSGTVAPAPVRYAEPSLAAAAAGGLALVVATAGSPVLLPVALLVLVVVAALTPHRRRLLWVAVPSLVVHGPLVVDAVSGWARGDWRVLLTDPGLPAATDPAPLWQQLLGLPEPGAPGATVLGADLAWGGLGADVVPAAVGALLVVPALLALVRHGAPGRAARAGWVLVAAGLLAGLVATRAHTAVAEDTSTLTTSWSGPAVSVVLAGLVLAGLVGADGLRGRMSRHTFGWRQATAGLLTVAVVAGPAVVLGAWAWDARSWSAGAAGDRVLDVRAAPVVPAVGQQMQQSSERLRVLALESTGESVEAVLLRSDGRRMTEVSRAVTGSGLRGGLGAATPAPADDATAEVARTVAALVAGTSDDVGARLAELGVGAVLAPASAAAGSDGAGPDAEAARAAADARRSLVARLDATLGLERMTETEAGVIWRVAAAELGTTSAWARLVRDVDGAPGELIAPVPAPGGRIETPLEPGDGPRLLVLAERADTEWRAWLDGRRLRAVGTGWQQAFEVPPEGGLLVVEHSPTSRTPWLVVQGVVLLATVLLALPTRRRRGGPR
ncbi:glycosyltransferase family 2 protein [Cellulomonas sp. APG4]|uniref:glycosyltransferase n=1 Tax=Cellulomonas sp. APG4 TaxID=1538656 RepID=UPI00137A01D8|nr:glycosyltransferase [Cellulomonas sp. APG4]NCT91346.1 glycosyltransferase family 2 protein [Cellulomonas sp. APG4]